MAKVALLIGVTDYQIEGSNLGFTNLPSAELDVKGMKRILEDSELGAFDKVKSLVNPLYYQMSQEIEDFLSDSQKDDLVLLYFSGHGVKDGNRQLYFAAKGTRKKFEDKDEVLTSTAVSARFVKDLLAECKATKKIMVLDCCFSGAIDPNAKGDDTLEVLETSLSAVKGSVILTSSSSTEMSYGDSTQMSFYTRYFVQGIETGEADQNSNGYLSIDELHKYVSEKLRVEKVKMNPKIFLVKEEGFYTAPLIKVPIADPRQAYRRKVAAYINDGYAKNGTFSSYTQDVLEDERNQINQSSKQQLSPDDAREIENDLLKPIKQRLDNLEKYRKAFRDNLENSTLDQHRKDLKLWQTRSLKLADTDVADIEQEEQQRLKDKQEGLRQEAEKQQQAQEQERQRGQIELERQQKLERQQQAQRQQELEQAAQRQRELEQAAQRQQELEQAAQRQRELEQAKQAQPANGNTLQPFEFETAILALVKKSGWLGDKTTLEIQRSRGRAQAFSENLGNGITLDMVQIPGGSFDMGSNEYDAEKPIHRVTVPDFFMGKYPVTQAQYQAIMGKNPSNFKGEKRPVEIVSWKDAMEFCQKLSQKTGRDYRLPSEAEWEYACRAGTTTPFHFGATITPDLVNYDGNHPYGNAPKGKYRKQTTEVGSFPPNAYGLYDLHGTVWEWCADNWHDNYNQAPTDGSIWKTSNFDNDPHVLRGGSWYSDAWYCRSASRLRPAADGRNNSIGFRVVCSSAWTQS